MPFFKLYELTALSCFHGSVLCSVLMYDLKLRNNMPTSSPNRKQFVSKVLPQLAGLQELAREKEMGGSDVSVANAEDTEKDVIKDESRDSDDRKEAIKRLKTSEYFILEFVVGWVTLLFGWVDSFVGSFVVRLAVRSVGKSVGLLFVRSYSVRACFMCFSSYLHDSIHLFSSFGYFVVVVCLFV